LCLFGSYLFYGWWDWRFLSLIFFSTVVDYLLSKKIHSSESDKFRKLWLILSLSTNLGLLFVFKYLNFFIDSFSKISLALGLGSNIDSLNIILPVGISFYTFQTLSYTIDVYKKELRPESNFITFATYVSFFPQLVAGPIVRASTLLPQFQKIPPIDINRISSGLLLVCIGYFRKVVIADTIAPLVDQGFQNPELFSSIHIVIIVFLYAFQIYCDFAGYSDIAIGIARILGFDFPNNFNFPYFSKNFSEFWTRWHISLSSWLRDYLYIPLGGSRNGKLNTMKNLMITMLLGGFWHGANWTFVIWGFLHGGYLILQRIQLPLVRRIIMKDFIVFDMAKIIFTFILTCFAWIFFRSQSLDQAIIIVQKVLDLDLLNIGSIKFKFDVFKGVFFVTLLIVCEMLYCNFKNQLKDILRSHYIKFALSSLIIWTVILFGSFGVNQFIYFQF
jgi:alginate O-acetyltransferase complex protein AlgI